MIAFDTLHPIAPGLERMLATLTSVLLNVHGGDSQPSDLFIQPPDPADLLRREAETEAEIKAATQRK